MYYLFVFSVFYDALKKRSFWVNLEQWGTVGRGVNCQIWTFHSFSVANIFFRWYVSTTVFLFWSLFTITPPYIGLEKHKFCIHFIQSSNSCRIQVTDYFYQLYPLNGTFIHQILYLRTIACEDNPVFKKVKVSISKK